MKKLILCYALATLLFSSCTSALLAWWGVRAPKSLNGKQIERYAKKYGADVQHLYKLDTAFATVLKDSAQSAALGLNKDQLKMLWQPLRCACGWV